jgi:hypothetical protein
VPLVWILAGLGLISCLGLAVMLLKLHLNFRSAPGLEPPPTADSELEEALAVSRLLVVVPAYNETDNIGPCLQALLASEPPCANWSVLVVDDGSTDETVALARAAAAEDPRFRLLEAGPRPSGERWVGKNWPCWRGSLITVPEGDPGHDDWLLFLDADVRVTPHALRWALADAIGHGADLLTLAPRLRCDCLAEWLVQPIIVSLLGLSFPIQRANDPSDPLAFASGPFMLFRHSSYRVLGGHRAVAAEVVEDLALGRAIKQAGLRLRYLLAIDLLTLRMYRDFGALWEGWTKNWFLGAERNPIKALGGGAVVVVLFTVPWLLVLAGGWQWAHGGSAGVPGLALLGLGLAGIALQLAIRLWSRWRFQAPLDYWWLAWAGGLVIGAIAPVSVGKTLTGRGWTWRGRNLAADTP